MGNIKSFKKKNVTRKKINNSTILIGLANIGANCYMNATLQCLSNTDKLTIYFLNKFQYNKYDDTKTISNLYYRLIHHLWDKYSDTKDYAPKHFKKVLSEVNSLFSGKNFNYSKHLLTFLLESLHTELNKVPKEKEEEEKNIDNNINQFSEEDIKQYFFKDFAKKYKSIISDLFYFPSEIKTKCGNCLFVKYNFKINYFLEFPLEKVNQYLYKSGKIPFYVNMDGSNPDINLYDCFEYNQKIDLMNGENQKYCNSCKCFSDSYYSSTLYLLPEILVINLDRGRNEIYQCNVNFPEELDLTNYVINKEFNIQYELYAVICQIGPSFMNRHIVAYCQNRMDDKWYLYNDSIISLCEKSNEYLSKIPYILFYKSKSINHNTQNIIYTDNIINNLNKQNNLINQNNIDMNQIQNFINDNNNFFVNNNMNMSIDNNMNMEMNNNMNMLINNNMNMGMNNEMNMNINNNMNMVANNEMNMVINNNMNICKNNYMNMGINNHIDIGMNSMDKNNRMNILPNNNMNIDVNNGMNMGINNMEMNNNINNDMNNIMNMGINYNLTMGMNNYMSNNLDMNMNMNNNSYNNMNYIMNNKKNINMNNDINNNLTYDINNNNVMNNNNIINNQNYSNNDYNIINQANSFPNHNEIINYGIESNEEENLNNQNNNFSFRNNNNEKVNQSNEDENIISIIFGTTDQKLHYSVPCRKTDSFSKIEKKLYNEYPEYKERNKYFLVNGNKIEVNKTLEENKIKNSDVIFLNFIEDIQ